MTFVVTDSCIQCKYTDCVEVCPVDCFHEGPNFLVIDPQECIDCALCVSECPVDAIKPAGQLHNSELHFLELNEQLSLVWPNINVRKEPLQEAPFYKNVKNKIIYLKSESNH